MHIICIGWLFVILMMSLTASSLAGGVLGFIFFGLAPVFLLGCLFALGRRSRQLPHPAPESAENEATPPDQRAP
ncbi:MAG: hypothetical protein LBU53_09390 [Zoogloeaceae bacterium]|jgi:hypothetical protein|nr:hypothetical protein [Zoogloeaceae bacterium]